MIKRVTLLFTACLLLWSCGKPAPPATTGKVPERIVSLAPNITETIYALGLGNKLVGATTYCLYPPEARAVPRIGGFGQFSYEAVVALHPDLAIIHEEFTAEKARLESLGIPCLETGNYFIADILGTIRRIGNACGAAEQADRLIQHMEAHIASVRDTGQAIQPARPRVLLTFGNGGLEQIHAFGPACFHNELLEIAGGQNVIEGKLPYATLSKEAVIRLNPDIVIQLAPEAQPADEPIDPWRELDTVNAIRNSRIHILTNDYTCIPGPRFIQTLDDFAEIIRGNQ